MLWVMPLLVFVLVGGINYLILRSRASDRDAIDRFLDVRQQELVSLRRGWRWLFDHVEGRPAISALTFPSRATRVYVLVTQGPNGRRMRWRIGFDPWSRESGLLVLSHRELPPAP